MALTVAIGSLVVGTAGALYTGVQQAKAADYNAKLAEQAADAAKQKAAYDEMLHRDQVRKLLSTQQSLYGKSGVELEGSPLLVLKDTAEQGELDALAIRYGADVNAAQARSAATLSRMQGSSARTASYFNAGSTLLQGASKFGTKDGKLVLR